MSLALSDSAASAARTIADFNFPTPPLAKPAEQTPFVRGEGDAHTVDPNDIKQDGYGSCAVLSTLHTIARQDPSVIQDMIQDNGDGTYTVTFQERVEVLGVETPFWKDVEVTVSGPFDGGAANPGDVGAGGAEVWPAIIEAAYAQQYKAGDTQYSTGVLPGDVMEAVLGAGADTVGAGSIDAAGMSAKLADGEAVVAWTPPFEDANGNPLMTPAQTALINEYGIAGGHAYAVSEIIPAGTSYVDASGTSIVAAEDIVVLDNPWGSSDVMMPYSDYQTVYGHVSSAPTD
ncbi:MAG TPA: C2 family cysteine protease [Luteimonas sp.]|nr:C2 family cysteine protease [Luteimonas sp.]